MAIPIEDLAKVQRAIDTLASGEGDLEALGISTLTKQVGSVSSNVDIRGLAELQSNATALTGSKIDLGGITKIANCYQNLPELLLEKVTQKTVDFILSNNSVTTLAQNVQNITGMVAEGKRVTDRINDLKEKSLVELLIEAKEANVLDRIPLIKTITEKYGNAVDNLNELTSNIANLDICSLTNYKTGSSASPKPSKIVDAPPSELSFIPHTQVNEVLVGIKNRYDDAMYRLKDVLSDKSNLENSPQSVSMLTSLQHITRAYRDKISRVRDGGDILQFGEEFLRGAAFEKSKHAELWSVETHNEFDARVSVIAEVMNEESDVIRAYHTVRGDGNVTGARLGTGVAIYGGPDWDFTTFLDLKPSERPDELTNYWTSRGFNIEKQESKLRARGIRPGTLNYSDTTKGAYGRQLEYGVSCASTKFPGGSILAIKNPDGSPYDPAGRNPEGLYRVDDVGNVEGTYKKVDIYIKGEDESAYMNSNMSGAQVFLVSKGTKVGPQYRRAVERYGNVV